MNQNHSENSEYVEVEVVESQPLTNTNETFQNYDQPYNPPKNSNKGCYLVLGCLFIFLVGLITVIGGILGFFTDILTSIF